MVGGLGPHCPKRCTRAVKTLDSNPGIPYGKDDIAGSVSQEKFRIFAYFRENRRFGCHCPSSALPVMPDTHEGVENQENGVHHGLWMPR